MKKILFLLLMFILVSCNKNVVFKETIKDFSGNRWALNDIKTFKINLKEDVQNAGIFLHFSHVFEPQYKSVPLAVVLEHPDGKQDNVFLELQTEDAAGNSLSDCAGDVCELTMPVKDSINLAKGAYKLIILNKFNGEYIPNVLALGVTVEAQD